MLVGYCRSKQRGFLELDLMFGTWAEANVETLTVAELKMYESLLDEEIPDMFKWLTGQLDPPAHVANNPVYR